jgi:uncharacterized spore protein YtfJ
MAGTTEVLDTIEQATEAMTVRRVFGEPVEKNGITTIPAASVRGGAGGGRGEGPDGEGSGHGGGFAMNATPAGAFVIEGDDVRWRPAIDVNKVILGAQAVAIVAMLLARAIVKARASTLRGLGNA